MRSALRLAAAVVGLIAGWAGAAPAALAQPQPAREPSAMYVWADGRAQTVGLVALAAGPGGRGGRFVRLDELARAVGSGTAATGSRVRFLVGGTPVDVADGVAFARVGDREVTLAAAPLDPDGSGLLIPLQLLTEVLPRTVPGVRFDANSRGLVVERAAVLSSLGRAPEAARPGAAAGAPRPRTETGVTSDPPPARVPAGVRRTVVVDAGHGGPDGGMRGTYPGGELTEKEVTLGIARQVRTALLARGADVVMTRDRDTLIALDDRGRIANARRGDLFVSIHVNAANPRWRSPTVARGYETYFLSDARTEDARALAARENESVRFETVAAGGPGADPLRFVMSDLAQNAHLRGSSRLAAAVQRRLGSVHPGPGRGVHQAGFRVLVTASMPAVLVETGFGSNGDDARYLMSEAGRREIAEAIADAAVEYLARYGEGTGRRSASEAAAGRGDPQP